MESDKDSGRAALALVTTLMKHLEESKLLSALDAACVESNAISLLGAGGVPAKNAQAIIARLALDRIARALETEKAAKKASKRLR